MINKLKLNKNFGVRCFCIDSVKSTKWRWLCKALKLKIEYANLLSVVIITGSAGFIGYRLAKHLQNISQEKGQDVIGVDELLLMHALPEHQDFTPKEEFAPEAILNESFFKNRQDAGNLVTGIFHMGACSDTTEMRADYLNRVNLDYSKQIWNLASKFKIPFVYASSAATYGDGEHGYADEETEIHKLKPLNLYATSKQQFDLWVLEQEKLGNTPPTWSGFKFFNVYGFGERHKGKMASVVLQGFDQIRKNGTLKLFKSHRDGIADGEQKRDFVYIEDVIKVLLFAFEKPIQRGIFNLGSGLGRSFKDLAHAIFKGLGADAKIDFIDTPLEIRDRYQYFTEAKMNKLRNEGYLNEFTSLEKGVEKTLQELLRSSQ